jgi:uncharacterized protein YggE
MKILPAATLLTALLATAPAFAESAPVITGTRLDIAATGSVDRTPDVATIGAGVVTLNGSAGGALSANAQRMAATVAALKKAGVADRDIQTSSLNLSPQYRYGQNEAPVLTGYQASNRVTVRLRDLARAGSVIDALVAAGANQIDGPTFTVDKPEAALDEARTKALATARARADLYARSAGLQVKRIVSISEGEAPVSYGPPGIVAMAKRADTTVMAGEQALSITLAVTFELN